MILLSIDTCFSYCSVSVTTSDKLAFNEIERKTNLHTEKLAILIESVLAKADLKYSDLELIAVMQGPGSFSGIRVGLACAYALQSLLNIPCIGVTSLEALALQLSNKIPEYKFYIAVSAGRNRYYCQLFEKKGQALDKIILCDYLDLETLKYKVYGMHDQDLTISAEFLRGIAFMKLKSGVNENLLSLPKGIYSN